MILLCFFSLDDEEGFWLGLVRFTDEDDVERKLESELCRRTRCWFRSEGGGLILDFFSFIEFLLWCLLLNFRFRFKIGFLSAFERSQTKLSIILFCF